MAGDAPARKARSDATRNRRRILEVAAVELRRCSDTPLSLIASGAGVGQGTLYRHFPTRESLVLAVHHDAVDHLVRRAGELLESRSPAEALRGWLHDLAEFALVKGELAEALREATGHSPGPASPGYGLVLEAVDRLVKANDAAGTLRAGVGTGDLLRSIAGLWQIDPAGDWRSESSVLIDIVVDGLRGPARP